MFSYFLKRKGFWSNRFLSHSVFFDFFLRPIVFLDTQFLERSQYWPQEKIRDIQWSRIKYLIDSAYQNVPFWQEHFNEAGIKPEDIKDWLDLQKIPIISKNDLRGRSFDFITSSKTPSSWRYQDSTSGSTGVPLRFVVDRGFILRSLSIGRRLLNSLGFLGGSNFVRFHLGDRPGFALGDYFFRFSESNFELRVADLVRKYGGKDLIIYATASYLFKLAKLIVSSGCSSIKFKGAIASGEELTVFQKQTIEKNLNCPVIGAYVSREHGWIAQECLRGNYHINSEWCYVEIVDDAGMVLAPGKQGRTVITNFDNEAMPLIRYEVGDLGEILLQSCPCGRTLPLIKFHGRKTGLLYLPDNRVIHHFNLTCSFHVRAEWIKRFQIIQEAVDRVTVKIVPEKNFPDAHLSTLRGELVGILGREVKLVIMFVDDLPSGPRGKNASFVSYLKKS